MIRNYSINPLSKRKLKKLDISEVETLLDIIPQATILIDGRDGHIISANAAMTELSAYTRDELSNMSLDELLAESDHQNIFLELLNSVDRTRMWELSMIRRGGGTIDIKASSAALDHDSEKLVITLEPASLSEQREVEKDRQRQLWEGLQTLAAALLKNSIEEALILALEASFVLTGSSAVAIYQANGDKPALDRTHSGRDSSK
jgi:PAS domain S-box-containing protein